MEKLQDLLQKYVNADYTSLLRQADLDLTALTQLLLAKNVDQKDLSSIFYTIINLTIAADGQFSSLEAQFLKDLFQIESFQMFSRETVEANTNSFLEQLLRTLNLEERTYLIDFCVCLLSIDKTITREEYTFIQKLLS